MAKNLNNDASLGYSGRFGQMFSFRQIGGETEAYRRPRKRKGPGTDKQEHHREKFLEATYYAKTVMADPALTAIYQEKTTARKSVYNLAVSDFIKAPVIKFINTGNYHGQAQDTLIIRAIDDFKVSLVNVSIYDASGAIIEQGNAIQQPNGVDWLYTAINNNPQPEGAKIKAAAFDMPGNEATLETMV